jgi:hypothetical protein
LNDHIDAHDRYDAEEHLESHIGEILAGPDDGYESKKDR